MKVRHKVFLLLSLVLLFSDVTVVWFNLRAMRAEHERSLEDSARQTDDLFRLTLAQTEADLNSLSAYITNDPRVQQAFLAGKKAVEAEGGGPGKERAAQARVKLLSLVENSWSKLQQRSDYRQLHFHFGPGSTSFLRVHRPDKFGDNMDQVRHTIVAANRDRRPTSGFETGRIISGIRGVEPVFAVDPETGRRVHVGALETGMSFQALLNRLKQQSNTNIAVFLTLDHMKRNIWPDFMAKLLKKRPPIGRFYIEASTKELPRGVLTADLLSRLWQDPSRGIVREEIDGDGRPWSVSAFSLRDFLGRQNRDQPDVGMVVTWRDESAGEAALMASMRTLVLIAIFAWLIVEILFYIGVCLGSDILERAEIRESWWRRAGRGVLCFLTGAFLLCSISTFQKLYIGASIRWDAFVVPFLFGGGFGWGIGVLIFKLIRRTRELDRAFAEREQLDRELIESEERLRTLINSTPDIVCFKDGENRWLEANESDLRLFRLEGVDYRGKTDAELVNYSPSLRGAFMTCLESDETAWRAGEITRSEEIIPDLSGAAKILDVLKVPTYHPDGSRKGLVVMGRDITDRVAAEKTIAFHSQVLSAIQDAIVVVSKDMTVLWRNRTARAIYGDQAEAVAEPCHLYLRQRDEMCGDCPVAKAIADKQTHHAVMKYEDQDDNITWRLHRAYPYYDDQGFVAGAIEIISDYTEQKRLLDALEQSEFNLNQAQTVAGVGSWHLDIPGDVLTWSDETYRMFGVKRGTPLDSAAFLNMIHPQDRPLVEMAWQAALEGAPYSIEHRLASPLEDRWIHEKAKVEFDDRDRPVKALGTAHNITERKQAEQQIKASETFLGAMIENIPDMIFVKEAGGLRFVRLNRAGEEMLGYPRESLIGKSDHDVFPPEIADFFGERDREVLAGGKLVDIPEERVRTKDKGERILHTKKLPIFDENGQPKYLLGISEDITEQKALEDQLRQARKMESIGTLAGGIAHDFNNLIYMITGHAELAMEDLPDWNPAYSSLREIQSAALRAAGIVKQLLSFSRKTEQDLKPVGAVTVIEDALNFLRSTIPATIEIRRHLPDADVTISADPIQINQVMMNLCTNASQAMEEAGGILDVSVDILSLDGEAGHDYPDLAAGDYVRVAISDQGPGIDPQIIDRIFDPYFTTKEIGKGSGMGLAVVHGIVKNHGGAITVESRPGLGAEFTILFPVVDQKPAPEVKPETQVVRGEERILFVDDEEMITDVIQKMLERLGYAVEVRVNPVEALELFQSGPDNFDLLIADMTMPQMTGVRLVEKIKAVRPDIPAIICTGHSSLIDEQTARDLGISAYVTKPISMKDISRIIRRVLDGADQEAG